ncbi:MAG: SAM-dependent methyltransferase [Spirochaetota bacterium]
MKKIKDFYYRKAKEENYPARSVYKLIEIDRKYHILKKDQFIMDIGCAPGSWSMYMLKKIGKGKVIGIDIDSKVSIKDPRFHFINEDILRLNITTLTEELKNMIQSKEKTRKSSNQLSEEKPLIHPLFDLIVSDAAPKTTGDKFFDSQQSLVIVKRVFEIAAILINPGASVVAKVFQGEDVGEFIRELKPHFREVHLFKPKSSRSESKELFIIALQRRNGE